MTWTLADALDRAFAVTVPGGDTSWWAWDSRGLLASRQDLDGVETTYCHDGRGFLAEETVAGISPPRLHERDAAGQVTAYTDSDGIVTEAVYTRAGLVDSMTRTRASGGAWDLRGRVEWRELGSVLDLRPPRARSGASPGKPRSQCKIRHNFARSVIIMYGSTYLTLYPPISLLKIHATSSPISNSVAMKLSMLAAADPSSRR